MCSSTLGPASVPSLVTWPAINSEVLVCLAKRVSLASIVYAEPMKLQKIERLQRVLNFLDDQWREPVSLADAAKVAALHPQSMSRFFQQHLGMNFQDYLLKLRLGRAARSLLETDQTVADIAFHSGFNNLANFNRHFKSAYHQTPSDYRKPHSHLDQA